MFGRGIDEKLGGVGVYVQSKHWLYSRLALVTVCGSNNNFAVTGIMHWTIFWAREMVRCSYRGWTDRYSYKTIKLLWKVLLGLQLWISDAVKLWGDSCGSTQLGLLRLWMMIATDTSMKFLSGCFWQLRYIKGYGCALLQIADRIYSICIAYVWYLHHICIASS